MPTAPSTWLDAPLSAELPVLRSRGEGQTLEYMERFPTQARDLAKEIAAFATSNGGLILIGVADDGSLCGIAGADGIEARDSLLRRIEGICSGTVKPSITPSVNWAVEEGKVILGLQIPKGAEPLYYSGDVPYIRHLSQSRPAAPHEVHALFRGFHGIASPGDNDPLLEIAATVAGAACDIVEYGEMYSERRLSPHREDLIAKLSYGAERLRTAAATDEAEEGEWAAELLAVARLIDPIVAFRPTLGAGSQDEFLRILRVATEKTQRLYEMRVLSVTPPKGLELDALRTLRQHTREFTDLAIRTAAEGDLQQIDELQQQAGLTGFYLLQTLWWGLHLRPSSETALLREVARDISLVETMRTYIDGGISQRAVIQRVADLSVRLKEATNVVSSV